MILKFSSADCGARGRRGDGVKGAGGGAPSQLGPRRERISVLRGERQAVCGKQEEKKKKWECCFFSDVSCRCAGRAGPTSCCCSARSNGAPPVSRSPAAWASTPFVSKVKSPFFRSFPFPSLFCVCRAAAGRRAVRSGRRAGRVAGAWHLVLRRLAGGAANALFCFLIRLFCRQHWEHWSSHTLDVAAASIRSQVRLCHKLFFLLLLLVLGLCALVLIRPCWPSGTRATSCLRLSSRSAIWPSLRRLCGPTRCSLLPATSPRG